MSGCVRLKVNDQAQGRENVSLLLRSRYVALNRIGFLQNDIAQDSIQIVQMTWQ